MKTTEIRPTGLLRNQTNAERGTPSD